MLEKGDVLLVKDGSTLGITNIVNELPFKCTVNSSIAVFRVKKSVKLLPEYLNVFLKSLTCQDLIDKKKDGMGVPHLFQSDINNFSVPVFDEKEQQEIIDVVADNMKNIEKGIENFNKQIEYLKEYKLNIIDSAVTGKIKVTNYAD